MRELLAIPPPSPQIAKREPQARLGVFFFPDKHLAVMGRWRKPAIADCRWNPI